MPATAKRQPVVVDLPRIRLNLGTAERVTAHRYSRTEFLREGKEIVGKEETTWQVPYHPEFAAWCHTAAEKLAGRAAGDAAAETVKTMRPQLAAHGYSGETLERKLRRIAERVRAEAFAACLPDIEAQLLRDCGREIDCLIAAQKASA